MITPLPSEVIEVKADLTLGLKIGIFPLEVNLKKNWYHSSIEAAKLVLFWVIIGPHVTSKMPNKRNMSLLYRGE